MASGHYVRFHYDNDYFTKTDQYYTQGIGLEVVSPVVKNFPLRRLLFMKSTINTIFGVMVDYYGYTPTSIRSDTILRGDMPFSSNLSLKTFGININPEKKQRLTVGFILGIMGQGTGGEKMQDDIHRWTGNVKPKGWQYQLRNDIILNYEVQLEQQLLSLNNILLLNGIGKVRLGTHDVDAKAGASFMLGNINNPFATTGNYKKKKFSYYLYGQITGAAVAFDASLQGGMFNRKSPYIIPISATRQFRMQADYGIVLRFKSVYLEYCQSFLTKRFDEGMNHRWGGVRIGVNF